MRADGLKIRRTISIIMIMGLALLLFLSIMEVDAQESMFIVEIEQERYPIDVSPDDDGIAYIDVSIRSTLAKNTIMDIHFELVGAPTWTVDIPGKLYMDPLGKRDIEVKIISPIGEPADKEAELRIWATQEGNSVSWDGSLSGDSCIIHVQPFFRSDFIIEEEYLTDLPSTGEFSLTIMNKGNSRAWIGVEFPSSSSVIISEPGLERIDAGDERTIDLSYSVMEDTMVEIIPVASTYEGTQGLEVEFIKDGEFFHILFNRGPFLILTDFDPITDEIPGVSLFSLGGDLQNVGLEILKGPEGATLRVDRELDMHALDREFLEYEIDGVLKDGFITIQGYGFDDERRVKSNPLKIWVRGERSASSSIPMPIVAGGGAATVSVILAGSAAYLYTASEVFKYRWLTLAFIPLYTVARKEKVLDHFFRGRLFEYIKENPGVTFSALKDHFEVNNGTLTYHLHKLEREDLITYRNLGRYKLFYADGVRIKGVEIVISPMDRDIVELVSREPGITSSQVIALLKGERSQRTVSRHLKQLERKGFILVERSHGARRLYISGDLERVLMPGKGVIEVSEMTGIEA